MTSMFLKDNKLTWIRLFAIASAFMFIPSGFTQELQLKFCLKNQDSASFQISKCKFYISLQADANEVYASQSKVYLIDLLDANRKEVKIIAKDTICFFLGTDSITNVSGVRGADLDPVNGMYWAWNSGYINFKLEGYFNHKPVIWHIGGYLSPWSSSRALTFYDVQQNMLALEFNTVKIISYLEENGAYTIMSPGKNALALSYLLADCFQESKDNHQKNSR